MAQDIAGDGDSQEPEPDSSEPVDCADYEDGADPADFDEARQDAAAASTVFSMTWDETRGDAAPPLRPAAAVAVLVTALASAPLLGAGYGFNLPALATLLAVTGILAGRSAGRSVGPWSVTWGTASIGLLCLASWHGEPGPYLLALFCAVLVGALAVHGGRGWFAVLFSSLGFLSDVVHAVLWARRGTSDLAAAARPGRMRNLAAGAAGALVLVAVFGTLFAAADPVFARLWDSADVLVEWWSPLPVLWFVAGGLGALTVGYGAAAPSRLDLLPVGPVRPLGRIVWLTPLAALAVLFAVFDVIQVSVLFGGYRAVLRSSGMSYADYARQGFWQLIGATVLTLAVIGAGIRWSPRGGARDARTASITLCTLSALTLIVVGSALRRMQMDVDAYGLTLPRVAVVAVEIWLGLLFLLLLAARCKPATGWLPRAVALSAVLVAGAYTAIGPAHLVAQVDVNRYFSHQYANLPYLRNLPADARPELLRLPPAILACIDDDQPVSGPC